MSHTQDTKYYLYLHTNKVNGKKYVGITVQSPIKRWGKNGVRYLEKLKNGSFVHPKFARAIIKYGWDNFDHQVWELSSEADMKYAEKYLIAYYDTVNNGYNITTGGEHPKLSEETKRLMSKNQLENWNNNDARKRKMSNFFKTIPRTEEWKRKISESNASRHPLIMQIKDGVIVAEFKSLMDAARSLNKKQCSTISKCVNNKRKTYLGYEWKYKE